MDTQIFAIILAITVIILPNQGCFGISCFDCASLNGSDRTCEDPFNATTGSYSEKCKVPKRGRSGFFPAHFCIKVIGVSYRTNQNLTIRRCVLENMDTQCGEFKFVNETNHDYDHVKGCILTCDQDGCNSSFQISYSPLFQIILFILIIIKFGKT